MMWYVIMGGLFALVPVSVQAEGKKAGNVVSVRGKAQVSGKNLKPGDAVHVGETIRTGESSQLKLFMKDRSILDLGSSTVLKVASFDKKKSGRRNVDLDLDLGRVRASVSKKLKKRGKFLIRTKSSVLAIRGTELVIESKQQGKRVSEKVSVLDGKIELSPKTQQAKVYSLGKGQQIDLKGRVDGGKRFVFENAKNPVRLARIDTSKIEQIKQESTVPNTTFENSLYVETDMSQKDPAGSRKETLQSVKQAIPAKDRAPASEKSSGELAESVLPNKRSPGSAKGKLGGITARGDVIARGQKKVDFVTVTVTFNP